MDVSPATARRARIDRADIVAAACTLLDEEGIDGLSMSRIGDRLGVTAMALYRHVEDRRDLEDAIVEHVFADLDTITTAGGAADATDDQWPAAVEHWMRQVRAHWLRHPWVGSLMGTSEIATPWLAALDRLALVLGDAGLPPELVARELVRISRGTVGLVLLEIRSPLPHAHTFEGADLGSSRDDDDERRRLVSEALLDYDNDDYFDDHVTETIERVRAAR